MECGIDEWGTGIKTDVAFTAADYRTVFDSHLRCLRDFQEATKKYELLDKICTKLYNIGWYIISLFIINCLTFDLASIQVLNRLPPSLLQLSLPTPLWPL